MNAQVKLVVSLAAKSLINNGRISGFKIVAEGHDLSIDLIEVKVGHADMKGLVDFFMKEVNSMPAAIDSPVEFGGSGESAIVVKGVKYSYRGNEFQIEEMEFSSIWEAVEFAAMFKGQEDELVVESQRVVSGEEAEEVRQQLVD